MDATGTEVRPVRATLKQDVMLWYNEMKTAGRLLKKGTEVMVQRRPGSTAQEVETLDGWFGYVFVN